MKSFIFSKDKKTVTKSIKFNFLSILLISVVGFVIYANSLNNEFVWDDEHLIEKNSYIKNWTHIPKIFTKDILAGVEMQRNYYRPLQAFTYMIDYSFFKLNPKGYHLTNIFIHILVSLSIFWLIEIIFNNRLLSLFTSLLFVVHPIHTEAIAYISGRADPLAAVFLILSLIFYIQHSRFKKASLFVFSLSFYILGLLSKEIVLILPLILVLYDYTFKENKKDYFKSYLPFLVVTLIYILLRLTILNFLSEERFIKTPLLQRLPGTFSAITTYFRLLLFPFRLHMEYGMPIFRLSDINVLLGMGIVVLSLSYAFKSKNEQRLIFFSCLWFFLNLIPVSNVYSLSAYTNAYMAEHWLYIPSIGFFLFLGWIFELIYRKKKRLRLIVVVVLAILLGFYACRTIQQNRYWKDPITLYTRTLKYAPGSSKVYYNLGYAYSNKGLYEKAIEEYKKALEIKPNYTEAYNNLGIVYGILGQYQEAIATFNKAIEINPNFSKAYNNLGIVYGILGQYQEAIAVYKKVIKIKQNYAEAHYNLGVIYNKKGMRDKAITEFKEAIAINPNLAKAHNDLAVAYYYKKQYNLAIRHCNKAIGLGYKVHPEFLKRLEPFW
jgi:tetratricopeptide (TPR) repeat protein